jgi:threonine aldolase
MNTKLLDFRSDTVTQPTEAMRAAMASAIVGDDSMGEDPTVRRLEAMSAELFGKAAGLFVISGTMANQVAIMALTQLGDEIIAGDESHLCNMEAAGVAALAGVQIRPLSAELGRFSPAALSKAIRPTGIQSAVSRVLCLENTYDLTRGIPVGLDYHQEMAEIAHRHDMALYLDGARIFNAAISQGLSVKALCAPIDALQFCLSKGLAAPVGALLLGSKSFIERARRIRQRMGGGMRQAGHMAAAGIVALEQMTERLAEDHQNATRLALGLAAIDERLVDLAQPRTNIVRIDFGAAGFSAESIVKALLEQQIKIRQLDANSCRMITHWGIDADDIASVLAVFSKLLKRK